MSFACLSLSTKYLRDVVKCYAPNCLEWNCLRRVLRRFEQDVILSNFLEQNRISGLPTVKGDPNVFVHIRSEEFQKNSMRVLCFGFSR